MNEENMNDERFPVDADEAVSKARESFENVYQTKNEKNELDLWIEHCNKRIAYHQEQIAGFNLIAHTAAYRLNGLEHYDDSGEVLNRFVSGKNEGEGEGEHTTSE